MKKKITKPQRPVVDHEAYHHMPNGILRIGRGGKRIFEELMAENFPKWMKHESTHHRTSIDSK